MNRDELTHFGVKGMRWGVRRSRPSGGVSAGKAKLTRSQKRESIAQAKKKAREIRAQRIRDIQDRHVDTILSVTERASNSVRGVAVAKVPGKLDFYRARVKKNGFINEDGSFEDDYKLSHVSPKILAQRAAYLALIGGGLASPIVAKAISNRN